MTTPDEEFSGGRRRFTDPWQIRCPEGHAALSKRCSVVGTIHCGQQADGEWYCQTCLEHYDDDEIGRLGDPDSPNTVMGDVWTGRDFRRVDSSEVVADD